MNEKLAKLMEKARKNGKDMKELHPMEKDAKMSVLNDLKDVASDAMKQKIHGLKKVQVMSDSDEGLKAGLSKAEDLISDAAHKEDHEMNPEEMREDAEDGHGRDGDEFAGGQEESLEHDEEAAESPEEELAEEHDPEHMDEEELNAKIEHLMHLKEKAKSRKA